MSKETAGEHFAPREVIRLMVNLLFIEDDDVPSSMNNRFTISRITSRGVKCSPAVSVDNSENRRISYSYR